MIAAIERLAAGNASWDDDRLVAAALAAGSVSIARGGRVESLGSDDLGAAFVLGDGNVILRVDALGLPRIMELLDFMADVVAAHQIGERDLDVVLVNLGSAYAALGENRRAIDLYDQALTIRRKVGDRRGEGAALLSLGFAYADLGESRRAIDLYDQALTIRREIGDRRGEGAALVNLGLAYAALGENRRAAESYKQAMEVIREIGGLYGENAMRDLRAMYARVAEDAGVRVPTASADDVRPKRNLNAWISNPRPKVGEVFRVSINIGTAKDTVAASVSFIEPDWGEAEFMALIVSVSCLDCTVVPSWQELELPRTGDSRKIDFLIAPWVAGDRDFTVRVYLAKQMIQLQSLRFTVKVAEARKQPAAVP